jgi:hypothetical protein
MPILPEELIVQLSGLVADYIATQRNKYFHAAIPLSTDQRTAMAGFFTPQLLDETRLLVLREERVANPDFYPMLRLAGFDDLPDQSTMAAVTFADCVVSHGPFTDALLFHELVHVEQYWQLGVPRFADLYLRGFLNGSGYFGIPLERNAYALGEQYEMNPVGQFSVTDEVARWISEDRF